MAVVAPGNVPAIGGPPQDPPPPNPPPPASPSRGKAALQIAVVLLMYTSELVTTTIKSNIASDGTDVDSRFDDPTYLKACVAQCTVNLVAVTFQIAYMYLHLDYCYRMAPVVVLSFTAIAWLLVWAIEAVKVRAFLSGDSNRTTCGSRGAGFHCLLKPGSGHLPHMHMHCLALSPHWPPAGDGQCAVGHPGGH